MIPATTPGQTVGPFFGFALPIAGAEHLVPPWTVGAQILRGRVIDGAGTPVPDALLEIRCPDPPRRPSSTMPRRGEAKHKGWGRCATDTRGEYAFVLPATIAVDTPFLPLVVFARGLLDRLFTRVYPPGTDPSADPFLRTLPPERARTLVATATGCTDGGQPVLRFDVRLQGADETVFLLHGGQA